MVFTTKGFQPINFQSPKSIWKTEIPDKPMISHFKPVTTRIERCIKIAVRPSSFYVTTRFITGFQVPVDTYCRKLYIIRTLQPNDVERISVAQNDRAITGFPPPPFQIKIRTRIFQAGTHQLNRFFNRGFSHSSKGEKTDFGNYHHNFNLTLDLEPP